MKDAWFYTLRNYFYPEPWLGERLDTDARRALWGRVGDILLQHQGIAITVTYTQKERVTETGVRHEQTIHLCSPVEISELEGEQRVDSPSDCV